MPAATTEVHTMVNLRAYCGSIAYELQGQPASVSLVRAEGEETDLYC
jgi:hypothetical protein